MQVLIAEDDAVIRTILRQLVESLGDQPVIAVDGEEAWTRWQERRCEAVISDWSMPGCDGLELLRRIREADGAGRYTYFILLTANDQPAAIEQGIAAGVDDHLGKPVRRVDLMSRLAVARRLVVMQQEVVERNRLLSEANRRMRRDLAAAANAQKSLLPSALPEIPGYALGWRYQPCEECAGDLLGVQRIAEDRIGLWVFDVSGHGVASALLAVQVARELPHIARAADGPLAVANALNQTFYSYSSVRFLTLLYGELDPANHRLSLVSCAHPTPLLLHADGRMEQWEVAAHPLGMFGPGQAVFQTWETQLFPGDRLLMVSDGTIESPSPDPLMEHEIFGNDRLAASWRRSRAAGFEDALSGVMDDLAIWRGTGRLNDDITLLGLQRT